MSTFTAFVVLTLLVTPAGLLAYRNAYRRHGHSTTSSVLLLLAAWFMPMCALGYSMPWTFPPDTTREWVGWTVMGVSIAACLVPLRHFGPGRVVGLDVSRLITTGAYRFSRNPQYVLSAFFPLGYALTGRSVTAWVAVGLMWLTMHATALIEEEHLERAFGDEYRRYVQRTPRYL